MITRTLLSAVLGLASCVAPCAIAETTPAPATPPVPSPLVAQNVIDLAARVEAIRAEQGVPALSLAWIRGGQVVAAGCAGVRKDGTPVPVTLEDQWHLGSCTKAMTATLAGILVEQGRITWDATIAQAFPELADEMKESYRAATLKDLLSHRSGIPEDRNPNAAQMAIWNAMRTAGDSLAERRMVGVRMGLLQEPVGLPGATFAYSNLGYTIAGVMLERAAGAAYEQLMADHLFTPLGMSSAGWGAPGTPNELTQPCGHSRTLRGYQPVSFDAPVNDNPAAIAPAGTCHASIVDWGRFIAAHVRDGADGLLATKDTFQTLHTALGDDYALGWIVTHRPWSKGPVLMHAGSNGLWFAIAWVAPEEDMAFIAMCNAADQKATLACDAAVSSLILDPPAPVDSAAPVNPGEPGSPE